ncbi:MAG: TonB-dependent receptor plug domain-containing protein [bacterium]
MLKKAGLTLLMLGLLSFPACAEEILNFNLDEIIVEDSVLKKDDNLNITEVNSKIVKPGKATNLADLLRDVAGIDVQQRAMAGDTQDVVKLRGFDGKRFTVLLDGQPINAAGVMGGNYIDWGTIPLEVVEKIEIIKGPKAARYGDTLGGVINILTKSDFDKPVTTIQAGFGNEGFRNYRISHSNKVGDLGYMITAGKKEADAYLRNNDYDNKDVGLKLNYTFENEGKLSLTYNHAETKRGFIVNNRVSSNPNDPGFYQKIDPSWPLSLGDSPSPAPDGVWSDGSYWKKENDYYSVHYSQPFANGSWRIGYYKNHEKRAEYFYNADGSLQMSRNIYPDESYSWLAEVEQNLGENHKLIYGYEQKRLRYKAENYTYLDPAVYSTTTVADKNAGAMASQKIDLNGLYIEDNWRVSDKLNLNLGLRYEKYKGGPDENKNMVSIDGSALVPKFNLNYNLNKNDRVYFSVNRAYRAPAMAELYWWSNYMTMDQLPAGTWPNSPPFNMIANFFPKEELKAEDGVAYELGYSSKVSDKFNYRASVYYNDIKDYINFDHSITPTRPAYNIDKVKIWGAELEAQVKLSDSLIAFANYTYQRTKKAGDLSRLTPWDQMSTELDYRPRHKANIGLTYKLKQGTVISLSERYVGSQNATYFFGRAIPNPSAVSSYCDLVDVPSYWITNLSITHPLKEGQELTVFVDNLFDKKYEERYGYEMPGIIYGMYYKLQF